MKKVFKGLVVLGEDACRCSGDDLEGSIWIGNNDIVKLVEEDFGGFGQDKKVIVGIADELFDGELFVETGWGYSEWTPMDSDTLKVGEHDIINILKRYEGKKITMFISDEPINILEDIIID